MTNTERLEALAQVEAAIAADRHLRAVRARHHRCPTPATRAELAEARRRLDELELRAGFSESPSRDR